MAEIGTVTYKVSLDTSDLKNQLNKVDQTIKSTTEKTSDNVAKHLDEIPKSVNKTAKKYIHYFDFRVGLSNRKSLQQNSR